MRSKIRIIAKKDIPELLSMRRCMEVIDACMREVSLRNVELPLRWGLKAGSKGVMGMMPGYLGSPECYGIKLVSLFPENSRHGISSHSGLMVLFEPEFGQPIAVMDAGHLTALRTAAASAVATQVLALPGAKKAAILGTGEQAEFHAAAMLEVQKDIKLTFWGRSRSNAEKIAHRYDDSGYSQACVAPTVEDAVADADIICSVTAAPEPILEGKWLPKDCHVNAVGASIPEHREIDSETVTRSRYFTDYRESCLAQAGELRKAIADGNIDETYISGEIGEVLLGECHGRSSVGEITLYRSLGIAAQDLAAAHAIYRQAEQQDVGTVAEL
ncbi:MAG: ornithine cyclodeaminase [Woeseia sp.]|nr:ornithine cyclodeaminase [Woeseia sp.]